MLDVMRGAVAAMPACSRDGASAGGCCSRAAWRWVLRRLLQQAVHACCNSTPDNKGHAAPSTTAAAQPHNRCALSLNVHNNLIQCQCLRLGAVQRETDRRWQSRTSLHLRCSPRHPRPWSKARRKWPSEHVSLQLDVAGV
eukprot:365052-Chlamydomonas_euryale.AAC.15